MSDSGSSTHSSSEATPSTLEITKTSTDATHNTATPSPKLPPPESQSKFQAAIEALTPIINTIPSSLSNSSNPTDVLLHDPQISSQISTLLRRPDSGAGDNHLCRWLYDTFQSSEPGLQLVVLRFVPLIAGVYLSRVNQRKPQAGFEAVMLAVYAHETTSRAGQAISVKVPDLSNPSIYHESNAQVKNNATELNIAVISPSLEPHGTVRSTRRAWIVGVALDLYYSKISVMPLCSKLEFCEFCEIWAGQDVGDLCKDNGGGNAEDGGATGKETKEAGLKQGRIPLPWELWQPCLRILGHCVMAPVRNQELYNKGCGVCKCLYARALHDINPKAILATGSLLKLINMETEVTNDNIDYTEVPDTRVISI